MNNIFQQYNASLVPMLQTQVGAERAEKELAQSELDRVTAKADALMQKAKDLNFQLSVKEAKTKSLLDGLKEHLPAHAKLIDELENTSNKIHDEDKKWLAERRKWTDYEIDKEEYDRDYFSRNEGRSR